MLYEYIKTQNLIPVSICLLQKINVYDVKKYDQFKPIRPERT